PDPCAAANSRDDAGCDEPAEGFPPVTAKRGDASLLDVSRDGRIIVARQNNQREMRAFRPGETREHDLSWLDWTYPRDISPDGGTVLFDESGFGGGPNYSVFVRKTNGSPAVRLGGGNGQALSPDGKLAIAIPVTPPYRMM